MEKFNVLILTDHSNHSSENSLYALTNELLRHKLTAKVDIVSRKNFENTSFFNGEVNADIYVSPIDENFSFTESGSFLSGKLKLADPTSYDLVWLRLPPPLSKSFLDFLHNYFNQQLVINNPLAIYETGSKEFLINFPELCPPLKICRSVNDIIDFKNQFPIVLKPFREYGGKGIVRIEGNEVSIGKKKISFDEFADSLDTDGVAYLGVKFLKNVSKGDKRIVVVNGKILGASLRLPAEDSWLCNIAMGGSSHIAKVDEDEKRIVEKINPVLSKMGIVMYGVDTLVGDDGKRILSELNTTSIGGLPQIAALRKLPLVEEAIDLIWKYFLDEVV